MKFPNFTLTPIIISFVLGVVCSFQFKEAHTFVWHSSLLLLTFLGLLTAWIFRKRHLRIIPVLLYVISFSVGLKRGQQADLVDRNHYTSFYQWDDSNEFIIEIKDRLRPTAFYYRYYGLVSSINNKNASGKLVLRIKKEDSLKLNLGSLYRTKAKLNAVQNFNNIGGFDYKKYLESIGIFHQINSSDFKSVKSSSFSLMRWLRQLKQKLLDAIEAGSLKENTKQLIRALILGERSELNSTWMNRYAQAGIVHLLAISGLHMGLLMVLLGWLYKPIQLLPRGDYMKVIIVVISLWTYALLTGGSASVVRAATIFSLYSIGRNIKQSPPTLYLLLLSFGVLVYTNPLYLKQLGFQMSYLAVFGILTLQPVFVKLIPLKKGVLHKFWVMTTVTLAAQIAVSPLAIYHFNQFPGLFLLTNWVVLFCISFYLYTGILSVALLYFNLLPIFMANLLDMLTLWLNNFILWIVKQEGFFIEDININLYEVFLFYAFLIFIYVLYLKANKKIIVGLFFVILILQYKAHVVRSLNEKLTAAWLVSEYKNTVLFHKKEAVLYVYSSDPIEENHQLVKDFKTKYIIKKIAFETLKNSYTIEENPVLFVDELWAENIEIKNEKTILVLSQNTKINLEAMLQKNKVYLIVTDGSSYPSLKERWRKTCAKLKTPYYDTQKGGPYLFTSKTRNISF